MLPKDYVISEDGTTAKYLFDATDRYIFNVFNNNIKGGKLIIIFWKHDIYMDGREVWLCLIEFYERKAIIYLVRTQCQTELSKIWLTPKYPGGALKFFQYSHITYLCEEDKIGQLNAALHDDIFQSIRTTCNTLTLQTGNPLDYPHYLQSMMTCSDNLHTSTRKNNRTNTFGGGR